MTRVAPWLSLVACVCPAWPVIAADKPPVWAREKVLATNTERVGTATQKFVIDVQ